MRTNFFSALILGTVLLATPAFALDLHGARQSGLVGEKADGYVTALQPSPDVDKLVKEVNGRRLAEYTRISKENGQPVNVVSQLAAGQIIQGLESGASYQDADGNWKKR
jgi:uncharacterized protein YdbL (DUF1318 family)